MIPKTRFAKFDIPKDCKLQKYTDELVSILNNNKGNDNTAFNAFRHQLFFDSFDFVRNELKTEKYPIITVDFVPTQAEYETLEKRWSHWAYEREKSTNPTLGFAITNPIENVVYVNMEVHLKLKTEDAFIFNLVSTLIHEILHCFFHNLKTEQEIFELHFKELEAFLGGSFAHRNENG